MKKSERDTAILNFLKKISLFQQVSAKTLQTIFRHIEERTVRSHDFLYYRGEESESLYIIRYGEIIIENIAHGGSLYVGPGDILSENSLLLGSPHSTSAYAAIDTLVYAIPRKIFMQLASQDRVLSQNIMKLLSSRMREHIEGKTFQRLEARRLYCHIPLDSVLDFPKKLNQLIRQTCLLQSSGTTVLRIAQFKGMSLEKFAEALSQIRRKTPLVHLYFDSPKSAMDFPAIVLQSDWLVFWEHESDKFMELKNEILAFWSLRIRNFNGRTVLYRTNFSGWESCLSEYSPAAQSKFHKIFTREDALARFLVGKTRGLALGGGGARALAHIGLLKQLERDGISFDYVSGASFGAVIAALYARGDKTDAMERLVKKFFGGFESAFDPTIPFVSFFRGKKMRKMLREAFGDIRIEELPVQFATSAVDLQSGKEHVFDRGPVVEALTATMSLPGAFPPYFLGEKVLVDGGMVNNVPGNLIRERGADIVLGINVSPMQEVVSLRLLEDRKSSGKSFFRYFWDHVKYPPILKIMGRTITLEGREITRLKQLRTDLFLNFHLEEFQLFDFARFKEIIEKGEREAQNHLKEIRSLFLPNKKFF